MHKLAALTPIRITVGSTNPVKIAAAHNAIAQLFPAAQIISQGIHAPSGVAAQPMTDSETRTGAINRARYCKQQAELQPHLSAELYIAMEGGVDCFDHGAATYAYMAIIHQGKLSIGRSAQLPLPPAVYQALVAGEELGDVMDRLFNTVNIKQKGGAIGLLTDGKASRESVYTQAIVLAMAPILNPQVYA
ncbi:inosine/xanthosine triphosphatase [Shewanella algidipiscicola]|uniref:Inosine/xanthosine triphosphatase n=1 Tax=Shewanella algidipiscicola TaxID=614070 RepID=A0ABQ4PIP6_9GAMM|nr:inosine/xanthosine triphosphatase [Shewanella algidipiscicola]GIU47324.1 non-canonical purine NTP phosphatase [Shewanella algidipiscicola]